MRMLTIALMVVEGHEHDQAVCLAMLVTMLMPCIRALRQQAIARLRRVAATLSDDDGADGSIGADADNRGDMCPCYVECCGMPVTDMLPQGEAQKRPQRQQADNRPLVLWADTNSVEFHSVLECLYLHAEAIANRSSTNFRKRCASMRDLCAPFVYKRIRLSNRHTLM